MRIIRGIAGRDGVAILPAIRERKQARPVRQEASVLSGEGRAVLAEPETPRAVDRVPKGSDTAAIRQEATLIGVLIVATGLFLLLLGFGPELFALATALLLVLLAPVAVKTHDVVLVPTLLLLSLVELSVVLGLSVVWLATI
jgi:hypothetical protein